MVEQYRADEGKEPIGQIIDAGTYDDFPGEGLETSPSPRRITRAMQESFKSIERLGSRIPSLGMFYGSLFYGPVLRRELKMAGIDKGSEILVIGSGHLPLTGLYLARLGHKVTCVDNDPAATASAQDLMQRVGGPSGIDFRTVDGKDADYKGWKAVWVTFNVSPKELILRKISSEVDEGAKVVYRNPRGFIRRFYDRVDPLTIEREHRIMRQIFGKESVILVNRPGCGSCGRRTLCSLGMGCEAVIASGPSDPVLSALGIRPGKRVKALSRQPFGGPMMACVEGRNVAIDMEMAAMITLH